MSKHLSQVSKELVGQVKQISSGLRSGLQAKEAELESALQQLEAERQQGRALQAVNVRCCVLV